MSAAENAQRKVANAILFGKLRRQPCEVCGMEPRLDVGGIRPTYRNQRVIAHHDDYSRPLDVRWLCRQHHIHFHMQRGDYDRAWAMTRERAAARRRAEEDERQQQEAVS